MIGHIRVHRPDHAQVVRELAHVLEQLTDLQPALAILLELKRALQTSTRGPLRLHEIGQCLPIHLRQHRLRIEGIDMRGASIHEEMHHALRLAFKVRLSHP